MVVMFFAASVLVACAGTQQDEAGAVANNAGSSGTLKVGINPDNPPIAYKDSGRLTGIEVVLAHRRLPAGAGARDLKDNRVIINYDLRLW